MTYKNYMEDAVESELNGVLSQIQNACTCDRCREDIVAYALNRLAPKYVSTPVGGVYTKFNQLRIQARADIVVQLTEGAKVVKERPRH